MRTVRCSGHLGEGRDGLSGGGAPATEVSAKGGVYQEGCLPWWGLPRGVYLPPYGQTDRCKNITLLQLLLGTVITLMSDSHLVKAFT